jgi:hypothetical protein
MLCMLFVSPLTEETGGKGYSGTDESEIRELEIRNNIKIQKEDNNTATSAGDRGAPNAGGWAPDKCGSFENRKIEPVR